MEVPRSLLEELSLIGARALSLGESGGMTDIERRP